MHVMVKRLLGSLGALVSGIISGVFAGKAVAAALPAGFLFLSSNVCGLIAVVVVYVVVSSALSHLVDWLWPLNFKF